MIIEVKCLPKYFKAVRAGLKFWELRYNDRNYCVGDTLYLCEWCDGAYTGRKLVCKITYILKNFEGLKDGWVILSIKRRQNERLYTAQ